MSSEFERVSVLTFPGKVANKSKAKHIEVPTCITH